VPRRAREPEVDVSPTLRALNSFRLTKSVDLAFARTVAHVRGERRRAEDWNRCRHCGISVGTPQTLAKARNSCRWEDQRSHSNRV
jgi:hypothetical protein